MSYKQNRTLKVYEQGGYKYKTIPTIMLKGQWLAELNFQVGDNIFVSCEEGKLVILRQNSNKIIRKDVQRLNFLCTYSFTQTKNALQKQNVFRNSFYTWQMSYY